MILNQLTIQALGPYKGKEVIDFDLLNKAQLFAISGKTGAGKTAIFDGICYALYGRASGQHRSNAEELRCIYAEDQDYTEASLEFTVRGSRYRARRQMGHIKKNNKSKTGGGIELHRWIFLKEKEDYGWESMLESGKVNEMNEKIMALTGLDVDQFRQIVMLPQGEFEKLLLAKAEDKKRILRQIFHTNLYQRFTEKLDQRRKEVDQEYFQLRQNLRSREDSLEELLKEEEALESNLLLKEKERNTYQLMKALAKDMDRLEERKTGLETQLEKQDELIQKADEHYYKAKENNRKLEELEAERQKMKSLEEQQEKMKSWQLSLEEAEKAQKIQHFYQRKKETEETCVQKTKVLKEAKEEAVRVEEKRIQAEKEWEEEEKKKPYRKEIEKAYDRILEALPKVEELSRKKERLHLGQKEAEAYEKKMEDLSQRQELGEKRLKELRKEQEQASEALEKEAKLIKQQAKLQQDCQELQELIRRKEEEKRLSKQKEKAEAKLKSDRKEAQKVEEKWLNNQARWLAMNLQEGEPCPVCGSLEHPEKATGTGEEINRKTMEEAKEKEKKANDAYVQVATKWETVRTALEEGLQKREDLLGKKDKLEDIEKSKQEEKQRLDEELTAMEVQRQKYEQGKEALRKGEKALLELTEKHKEMGAKQQELTAEIATLQGQVQSIEEALPEHLLELKELEKQKQNLEAKIEEAKKAYEKAESQYKDWREKQAAATVTLEYADKNQKEAKKAMENVAEQWKEKLAQEGFESMEAYVAAHRTEEKMKKLREALQQYKEQRSLTEEKVKSLEILLKKVEKEDLEAVLHHCQQLRQEQKKYQKELGRKEALLRETGSLKSYIEKEWEKMQEREEERNRIANLYQCANGTGNEQKLALETYVLQHYFHRVLKAANLRLDQLTMGRYRLVADQEREKHGGRSGLGIDVIDVFNEQQRSVRTFSGGEKFNASLCLALGLFDVIQSESGGTEMKTMFIDEGFGSLDTQESLPKAIQMLNQIQETGRVIGVISHVSEMKEQLPAILEVIKASDGSSTTRIKVNA
ncbi:exonuclease SbcC [Tindallia magadiensis]|uniref:Nuclease SbcCD subunit C n=1 Tax=Tindallia magadiensis TaxID=69895 RepID=A0A1I3CTK4_9FIRM|nr:SMC family ATPase [Tindallia magadiensis]SFH77763.1 exonuclease SbcC [Tindallia magadiensis]